MSPEQRSGRAPEERKPIGEGASAPRQEKDQNLARREMAQHHGDLLSSESGHGLAELSEDSFIDFIDLDDGLPDHPPGVEHRHLSDKNPC